ncbi:toprim domain-containing protein [Bordetella hinzii]|uniref:toprim domain-containing protein n=1 Tax=Bordetella hinzii TaxID=103855 RepID=UPI00197AD299|nr:toprim domain-containing protein [Bordetella hinzii]
MSMPTVRTLTDWFDRLKRDIDLHDLADRLGLQRQGGNGNYHSPHHTDKSASVSIFNDGRAWKDWSGSEAGGSCIDLMQFCLPELSTPLEAAKQLGQWYGIPIPSKSPDSRVMAVQEPRSKADYIAERCLADTQPAVDYLIGRGISEAVAARVTAERVVGWNIWASDKVPAGQARYGGPAAAFIVREPASGRVVAVDLRYADPELNGGIKTQCQGEKQGYGWTSDVKRLRRAHTVYIVESPVNALSVECGHFPEGIAAFALRGIGNIPHIDWSWLRGKRVLIALDHADAVNERTGQRPGLAAAWQLSEILTAQDISSMLVDMQDWEEGEDINDVLKQHGADELTRRLKVLEPWLIPGMPGNIGERSEGTRRIFLPGHDFGVYWRYRVTEDFTRYVVKYRDNPDDDGGEGDRSEELGDLCAFRVVGFSRLHIQGHVATINGTPDTQPKEVYGVSAQVARDRATLRRDVIDSKQIYNQEWWRNAFGHIWKPSEFARMVNILERTADLGARNVVNFIGLAWRAGELTALEGKDCYFIEPQKQCLYHNMAFPRGSRTDAATVIAAYQETFSNNAAAIGLVWALGAHLKMVLGFYPHFQMQAQKGAGKSQLLDRLQSTIAFQMLSAQMLKTDHRRRASVSYTTHPVGWDEFSKLPKAVLSDIDGLLQSTYRTEFTRVGASLVPYLMCAPVLLAGEEVDVESLQSKICRTSLSVEKQGPLLARDLPQFPVWEWIQFLATQPAARVLELHAKCLARCAQRCRADERDATARRMLENYAAVLVAWVLLAEFAGIEATQGSFAEDLMAEMNAHIVDTNGTRLPWVWIMEIVLSEIEAQRFAYPYTWDKVLTDDGEDVALFVRPNHIMDHISTAPHLRVKFDTLPIKTGRIFKQQLMQSGVVVSYDGKPLENVDKIIRGSRAQRMTAISLAKLEALGLYATPDLGPPG